MANTFNPVVMYKDVIDQYFERYDLTDVFEKPMNYINGEYKILKVTGGALGKYTRQRAAGQGLSYAAGSVSNSWESIKSDVERSFQILIDKADDLETFEAVFDEAVHNYIQAAVVERMARRHAAIASADGITIEDADVSTGEKVVQALRVACNTLFNNHVPVEDRVLIIRGDVYSSLADLDAFKSKAVLTECGNIITVTPDVLYTAIELSDTTDASYTKADGAKDIAFILASRKSLVSGTYWEAQFFDEGEVQDFRGSKYNYYERPLDAHVYDNKAKGIYVATATFQ